MSVFRWRLALLLLVIFFSECTKHLHSSEILAGKRNAQKGVAAVPASIHPSQITSLPPQVAISISFWFISPASALRKI